MQESAAAAATDCSLYNQEVCAASRFVYAEGDEDELAQWCELLARELAVEREWSDAVVTNLPADIKAEVDVLRAMEPMYQVFGSDDGSGLVVLSDDPVDFHPSAKTVNVVRVPSLEDALVHVNVATQTIGLYPEGARRRTCATSSPPAGCNASCRSARSSRSRRGSRTTASIRSTDS